MKILMLADGRSAHTQRFQAAVKSEGHDLFLASLEKGETVDYQFKSRSGVAALDYILAVPELGKIIKRFRPDIINPHFACNYGFMTALCLEARKMPGIMHCLGSDILVSPKKSPLHRMRVRYTLINIPEILVDSVYLGEAAINIFSPARYTVIPWGADDMAFGYFDNRPHSDLAGRFPLKIIVPRPHKVIYNNELIIRSLMDFMNRREVEITFPDWGDGLASFRRLARKECPGGIIKYYAFMTRDKYNEFLSGFDIYLSASRSDSSPASLIEAMAIGLFPIAADIPGIREWLTSENGLIFDLDQPESLENAIQRLRQGELDIAGIIEKNHDRANREGRFSENIRLTLEKMQESISRAVR